MSEKKGYSVYMHTNIENGKVYIGKCYRKPSYRWGIDGSNYLRCSRGHTHADQRHFAHAIKKYGWENFKHEVLYKNLSADEAAKKEIALIAKYNSDDPSKGYNMTKGGEGCSGRIVSFETRKLLKSSLRKYNGIFQYNKNGKNIREWANCEEILNYFKVKSDSNLYSHLLGKQKTFCGYIFKLEEMDNVQYKRKTTSKKIRCYSKEGDYIKTFESYQEAYKETGALPSVIVKCLRNECVSAGGYVWRRDEGNYNKIKVRRKYEQNYSPVLQLDYFGNIVAEYDSITEAQQQTGIGNISAVCRRLRQKAGGFRWEYKGNCSQVKNVQLTLPFVYSK
ncbi:MAG: hypothetical protein J6Y98_01630 [Bacteroidales bacterium]|nr:hypothetical protein [Bacteroidales bacterium]